MSTRRPPVMVCARAGAALALAALAACSSPDAGLVVAVLYDPALALDQLALRLSAGDAVEEVVAPDPPAPLADGEESLGFLLPEALVDVEVTVSVTGRGQGDEVATGEGAVTTVRGQIASLEVELAPLYRCGNALIEVRETCDDGNAAAGDGCDDSCNTESGYVCAGTPSVCALCGDGSIDAPESCDDGGRTDGDGCDAECAPEAGWDCGGAQPSTCVSICGDGLVRGSESCDDGGTVAGDGCATDCAVEPGWDCGSAEPSACAPICGDGLVRGGERCDDGATVGDDGCSAGCALEAGWNCDAAEPTSCVAICGDGLVRGAEACDDLDATGGDGCGPSCAIEAGWSCDGADPTACAPVCGDGLVRGVEACDDLDVTGGDGCGPSCALEAGWSCDAAEPTTCVTVCGDGLVRGAEACDDLDATGGDGCGASCAVEGGWSCNGAEPTACTPVCGDGLLRGAESCDDNDTAGGDGCSASCAEESGYQCTGQPSSCVTVCGDGIQAGTEACDDGAANSDTTPDACRTDCTLPFCGDLVTDSGEGCDDGDLDDRDGCRTGCRLPACGDGLVLGSEACDDGNNTVGDGCGATCAVEGGSSCFGEPSVCAATALTHVVAPSGGQFTSIDAADNSGTVQDGHLLFVRAGTYAEEIDLSKDLTIVGVSGALVQGSANNVAAIFVRGGAVVTLRGLEVRHTGNNDAAVELASGANVTVVGCTLGPTENLGIVSVAGSTVVLRRTRLTGNFDGGADLAGTVTVENSVFSSNGNVASTFGGARLRSAATFRFSTVVGNTGATGVLCDVAATLTSSILYGNAGPEASGNCGVATSWVQGAGGATDPLFLGDGYHLGTGSPVIDQAPLAGCLAEDFDGQARPMGAACERGADERP